MQTRYMERSNSMAREKRKDPNGSEEDQPAKKRPALARGGVRGGYGGGGDRRRDNYRDGGSSGPDRNYHGGGNRSRPY